MEEYGSNSDKALSNKRTEPVKPVVTKPVKVRKPSGVKKFFSMFISDNIGDLKSYVVHDVIIPTLQDTVINSLEMIFHGRSKSKSRVSTVDYSSISSGSSSSIKPSTSRVIDSRRLNEEFVYETRGEADVVLDGLNDILQSYGIASVADLYDLSGKTTSNYTLQKYGWRNLDGCRARRIIGGYVLDLPKATPIN